MGCITPHKCAKTAREMERSIFPKFCLTDQLLNNDGLLLTPKRLEENEEARKENGPLTFNPSIRIEENPEGCIRVFTMPGVICKDPAKRKHMPRGNVGQTKPTVHFEGAGRRREVGADLVGSRIWYGEGDEWNAALCIKHDVAGRIE